MRPNVEVKVAAFSKVMISKLHENDHKGTWQDASVEWLLDRLRDEMDELKEALETRIKWGTRPNIAWVCREAADVANYAMMISDVCGGLEEETP